MLIKVFRWCEVLFEVHLNKVTKAEVFADVARGFKVGLRRESCGFVEGAPGEPAGECEAV